MLRQITYESELARKIEVIALTAEQAFHDTIVLIDVSARRRRSPRNNAALSMIARPIRCSPALLLSLSLALPPSPLPSAPPKASARNP